MDTSAHQPLQGMTDLTEPELALWRGVEETARQVFALYGFGEIRTPILEHSELFTHALGQTTDVVRKEMYTFADPGGRSVCLRPEGTAGVVRYASAGGPEALGSRLYYIGPMFRAERPQAGRRRQFHQIGVEMFGPADPGVDAECIALQVHLLAALGLEGGKVLLNTRGMPDDQETVRAAMRNALEPQAARLCEDCRRRLAENVLRVLDCKQADCRALVDGLPDLTAGMCQESLAHFRGVRGLLDRLGIEATVQPKLVRGLDYYLHTVWEITHGALGAQDALAGGGRYLVKAGDKDIQGVGFAMGIERLVAALEATGAAAALRRGPPGPRVWLVSLGEAAREENMVLMQALRKRRVPCGMAPGKDSMKAQMRAANRSGAPHAIILGPDELAQRVCVLKDMQQGAQERIPLDAVAERLAGA